MSLFPLESVSSAQLEELCRTLWAWPTCTICSYGNFCKDNGCAWKRMKTLSHFLEYYKDTTAVYEPDVEVQKNVALNTHEDLFEVIRNVRSKSNILREQVTEDIFADRPNALPDAADQRVAVDIAVSMLFMMDSSDLQCSPSVLERGLGRLSWRHGQTLTEFVEEAFQSVKLTTSSLGASDSFDVATVPNASTLKKRLDINFRPTDDIRNHLRLNRRRDILDIFHHTAFLKEHLRLTKDDPFSVSLQECVQKGALPRQVALEVLDSIQKILFPRSDKKSRRILSSLTSSSGFDPDSKVFESASIRNPEERNVTYQYFGARLADLMEELENPSPRSWLEKWVERKSGARYVMMATLAGVAIAIILGFFSLVVECYSAWVGYQQWKHPVNR